MMRWFCWEHGEFDVHTQHSYSYTNTYIYTLSTNLRLSFRKRALRNNWFVRTNHNRRKDVHRLIVRRHCCCGQRSKSNVATTVTCRHISSSGEGLRDEEATPLQQGIHSLQCRNDVKMEMRWVIRLEQSSKERGRTEQSTKRTVFDTNSLDAECRPYEDQILEWLKIKCAPMMRYSY